jgi:ribose-phosphate pyrophosphokinase
MENVKLIGGSSNPILLEDIFNEINFQSYKLERTNTLVDVFSDGESRIEIHDNMRGQDVFVLQSLSKPVNHYIVELCLILDALKRSNINSVTVILPYYGYARQDRKVKPRVPISAKVVGDLIQSIGIDRLVTIDLHSGQIQGFFDVPVDNLFAAPILLDYMKKIDTPENLVIVSPDAGGIERATYYSKKLNCGLAYCYKHRENPNEIVEMRLVGCVENKTCLLVDDMIDTSSTLVKSAYLLKENGASYIESYATHGVFSGNAVQKITDSPISKIFVTDTIKLQESVLINQKFNVIGIGNLIAKAIIGIQSNNSLSKLFI